MNVDESRRARADAARAEQEARVQCLQDAGFPADLQSDGNIRVKVNPDQQAAYQAASEACDEQVDPGVAALPLSDAELEWLYGEYVASYECLKAQGYDPVQPPSLEAYIGVYRSGEPTWSPYESPERAGGLPRTTCPEPDLYATDR
ncbi:hypothetical protein [Ornithinimicrobium avium]|uniref:Uncharacterized protein n=1 Tax=Ornithinimicrobium avium TaxID=2283195 RepID=A0A345NR76_9MICO|nr:hypothetical protein [Ornithinimicrobium avium]AXH97534.1 hypothetical protein DV701_16720 [Ornithinimicrobium avium]